MSSIKSIGLGIVASVITFTLLALGLHLYADHQLVDAIRQDIAQQRMQASQVAQPAPAPTPAPAPKPVLPVTPKKTP